MSEVSDSEIVDDENDAKLDEGVAESSFERSVFTEFFSVVANDGKNIRVTCKLCPPASIRLA
jgi:hypothetical protein